MNSDENLRQLKYDFSVRIIAEEARKLGISPPEYGQVYDSEAHERLLNYLIGLVKVREKDRDTKILESLIAKQRSVIEHGADFNDMNQYFAVPLKEIEAELAALKEVKK